MKMIFSRLLALVLCFCLLPVIAFADTNDGTPVTRADFELSFHLNADGFPEDGRIHAQDWEAYLSKLSLRGVVDAQSFPSPYDRVYFNGGLYLNDKLTIPFEYDGYHSFRYVRSPALGGASIHFQMFNFLQFMLKPYYYMGMPTQYAALLLYPEATVEMWRKYAAPFARTFAGEGSRTVGYDALLELCGQLNDIIHHDEYDKAYYYLTCLLTDLGMDWTATEKLGAWENLLAYLDPAMQGMSITVENGTETWVLGGTTVLEKSASEAGTTLTVTLPYPDGYHFCVTLFDGAAEKKAEVLILLDGEEYLRLNAGIDGLPADGALEAQGRAWAELGGSALYMDVQPLEMAYTYTRTAPEKPCDMALTVDLIHPETGLPGLGFELSAAVSQQPHTVLVERTYDDQEDFFHLNESYLEEHKERFLGTLALAAAPMVLELPAGVMSDAIAWMEDTGVLAFLGFE